MANQLGNNGTVEIGGNEVAEMIDFSYDEGVAIIDNTPLGASADTHLAGTTNANGTMNCMWDKSDATGQEALTIGASVSIVFYPEGNSSGKRSETATATVESVGVAVAKNTVITRNYGLNINGAITKALVV